MDHILESHKECMVERCRRERVVLAVQDTTMLNYNGLEATSGLVPLGGGGSGTKGIAAHFGLAITTARRPLGVFEIDATMRDGKDESESVRWLKHFDKAQEIARACPGTRVVTVCDREGDIWELLSRAVATGTSLVVRACRSKQRRVLCEDGKKKGLWDYMAEQPVLTRRVLTLASCGGKRARKKHNVTLGIRAARIRLVPPGDRTGDAPLSILAVSVVGPQDLDWLLLTTEGQPEKANAVRIVKWYERRWTIEEYFKALKSGMGVEDRRFDDADDLRKCLAFDAITACRVFDLQRMARDRPNAPAAEIADQDEIAVLYLHLAARGMAKSRAPPKNLDARTFVLDVARLAGFHSSKRQPLPGTIWQGYGYLKSYTSTYQVLRDSDMLKTDSTMGS